jgi:hypothetical protein
MRNRSVLVMLLVLLAIFLTVKFDLLRTVRTGITNMLYGDELRAIKGFRIHVDLANPELAMDGLTGESIRTLLTTVFGNAGTTVLTDNSWEKIPGRPSFNVSISATKQPEGGYQYVVSMDLSQDAAKSNISGTQNQKIVWASSEMGTGRVEDIRKEIDSMVQMFLNVRSDG